MATHRGAPTVPTSARIVLTMQIDKRVAHAGENNPRTPFTRDAREHIDEHEDGLEHDALVRWMGLPIDPWRGTP